MNSVSQYRDLTLWIRATVVATVVSTVTQASHVSLLHAWPDTQLGLELGLVAHLCNVQDVAHLRKVGRYVSPARQRKKFICSAHVVLAGTS